MTICTHSHSYWAGIVRTCPFCGASYSKPAQAIEARRAETHSGSVHESAVRQDAPNPNPGA